jgi:hypothetical protein
MLYSRQRCVACSRRVLHVVFPRKMCAMCLCELYVVSLSKMCVRCSGQNVWLSRHRRSEMRDFVRRDGPWSGYDLNVTRT